MSIPGRTIALTGADGFLGRRLLLRLEDDPTVERVRILDVRNPDLELRKAEFHRVDLTRPTSDLEIAALLEGVDTLVHLAFLQRPVHNTAWAHELESVGTMLVLNACAEAGTARLVMLSTTLVYGADPKNPNFLSEEHALPSHGACAFIDDKIEVERQARRFREKHPRIGLLVLRMAPLCGPTVRSVATHLLERRVVPVAMGYDPLLQLLHEDDAVNALKLGIDNDAPELREAGVVNVVCRGVIPLSRALRISGAVGVPMPSGLARGVSSALWSANLGYTPPGLADYLKYQCVADGARGARLLGFHAQHGAQAAVQSWAATRRLRQMRVA